MRGPGVMEGFWLPKGLRECVCSAGIPWERVAFAGGRECGRECEADAPDAVSAPWPVLGETDWTVVLEGLAEARRGAPLGRNLWDRLQTALRLVAAHPAGPGGPVPTGGVEAAGAAEAAGAVQAISRYTGYSPAMVDSVMSALDIWELGLMAQAFAASPTGAARRGWEPLPGLPGRVRFTPAAGDSAASGDSAAFGGVPGALPNKTPVPRSRQQSQLLGHRSGDAGS